MNTHATLRASSRPFPGLRPFRREESDIFFGREEQMDELLTRLGNTRFLSIIGESGCGKSSLVYAGLLAALETGFLTDTGSRWRQVTLRPGNRPLRSLAEALVEADLLSREAKKGGHAAAIAEARLREGRMSLVEMLRRVDLDGAKVLLFVDQFEELFRFRDAGVGNQADVKDDADAFVALLLATYRQTEVPVYVVLTMRSDFLGDCALFPGLPETLNDSQFLTPRLTRGQRQEAMEGPAAVFDARIEPALVARLLNDMGSGPDQLPLMQHVLMRMWTKATTQRDSAGSTEIVLTLDDYLGLGGLQEALSRHADEAYQSLRPTLQPVARTLFKSLCERGVGKRDTRRPVRLGEVAAIARAPWEQVKEVVETFRGADYNFLMPAAPTPLTPETKLDISHESLIRKWKQLQDWTKQEALAAEQYRYLELLARQWQHEHGLLLSKGALARHLEWWANEKPNADWARRYGGDFDLAAEYLRTSEEEQKRRDEEEKAERLRLANLAVEKLKEEERAVAERKLQALREEQQRARVRGLKIFSGCVIGFAVVASLLAVWAWNSADRADEAAKKAKKSAEEATNSLQQAKIAEGKATILRVAKEADSLGDRDPQTGILLALEAFQIADRLRNDDSVKKELAADPTKLPMVSVQQVLRRLLTSISNLVRILIGHTKPVVAVRFSADGRWLFSASQDSTVRRWDMKNLESGAEEFTFKDKDNEKDDNSAISAFDVSGDGRWLAVGCQDGRVLRADVFAKSVAFAPPTSSARRGRIDGPALASLGPAFVAFTDPGRKTPDRLLGKHDKGIVHVAVSQDGDWAASASVDGKAYLWGPLLPRFDVKNQMKGPAVDAEVQRHELTGHAKALLAVRFSPGKLVTVDEDRVQLWTLPRSDQEKPQSHMVRHAGIKWAGVSPDGRWVAVADVKGAVATIDLRMLIPNQGVWSKLKGVNLGEVQAGAFSVEGRFLVIGDQQGQIQRWDLASRQALEPLQSDNPVEDLAVGPACQFIACKTEKNNLQIWEQTTKGKEVMERRAPFRLEKPARTMAFSPDGRWLAAATTARDDTSVRLMGLAKASASPLELPWNQRGPASSALSPDGAWLASVMDKGIDLFHLRGDTASEPQRLESNLAIGNQRIVFSPQDRWLVCAEPGRVLELGGALEPGRILVWRLARLEGQTAVVKDKKRGLPPDRIFKTDAYPDVSFSPDGRWMLVEGAELHVWNLEKGDPPVRLADGSDKIGPWAFDRGSRWLAAAGQATSIWSLAEDRVGPRVTLTDSKDKQGPVVGSLQFSPGGQWLTGHGFGWVKVWRPGAPTSIELPGGHDVQRLHGFASDRLLIGDTEKGVAVYSLREEGEQVPPKHVAISDRRGRRTVISPNGSLLAADILTVDGPWIYVMDLTSELPREPNIGEAKPGNVEPRSPFSPDGHWLVTVGDDKIARLWDLSKRALREPAYLLKDHLHLCFSPDSRWLLYGDQSKAVWLRDLSSPTLDPVLLPTTEWTGASLSFTGDGRFACTPCLGSIMRLWHVNVEELLPLARKAVGRELTAEERKQFDLPEPAPR